MDLERGGEEVGLPRFSVQITKGSYFDKYGHFWYNRSNLRLLYHYSPDRMADTEPIIGNGASGILPEGLANMQKHPPKAQTIMDLTRARCSRLVLGLTALGVVAATNVADAKMTSGVAPVPTDGT